MFNKLFFILLFISFSSFSQFQEEWSTKLNEDLKWQKVTKNGTLLVSTENHLTVYDQETGDLTWSNPNLANFERDDIREMNKSPLLIADKGNDVIIFNPLDGKIVFNSKDSGISELSFQKFLYKSNNTFISGKDKDNNHTVMLVNNETGEIIWRLKDKLQYIKSIDELTKNELLILTMFSVTKLDLNTGNIIWENIFNEGFKKLNSELGGFLLDLAEKYSEGETDYNIKFYKNYEDNSLIITIDVFEKEDDKVKSSSTVVGYNIKDGSKLWKEDIEYTSAIGDIVFYKNGAIVMPKSDGGIFNTKINYFDYNLSKKKLERTRGKWGKKGKGLKIKQGIYKSIRVNDNILIASTKSSLKDDNIKSYLTLIDPRKGKLIFEKVKVKGKLQEIIPTKAGLTYITSEEINIINPSSGDEILDRSISTRPGLIARQDNIFYVFDESKKRVKELDINKGTVKRISDDKLRFKGGEDPVKLELRNKGYLLTSSQNIAFINENGEIAFNKYYKSSSNTFLKKVLLVASAVNATRYAIGTSALSNDLNKAKSKIKDSSFRDTIAKISKQASKASTKASGYAENFIDSAFERYKASFNSKDFIIMLTKKKGDNYLIKVSKETGNIIAKINLGNEKKPQYSVDQISNKMFLYQKPRKIVAYKL